jgi:hypothetical protein
MNRKETWKRLVSLGVAIGKMPSTSWELSKANLAKANLAGADLFEARLSKANLAEANLAGANLAFVDLYDSDLAGANLAGANLAGANLARANLAGANLSEANLGEANLSEANLAGATMEKSELFASNFKQANLKNVNLRGAITIDTDFSWADLSGSDITASVVWGVKTTGWTIDGIKAEDIYFCGSKEDDKEKYRRSFEDEQFAYLFKCFPMIELIFEERLSVPKLFVLMTLIEKTRLHYPEFGIGLEHIVAGTFKTRVIVRVNQDANLNKVAKLIQNGVNRSFLGVSDEALASLLSRIAAPSFSESIVENVVPISFQLIKADGTLLDEGSKVSRVYKPWMRG